MADTDTIDRPAPDLPPVEDVGGDVRLAPPPPKPPPEKTPSQRAAEREAEIIEHEAARWPEVDRRREESWAREDEIRRQQLEFTKQSNDELIRDIDQRRQWRDQHPRPEPPTISQPPQFHLTPPPGLFGDNSNPRGQDAPGNQWMQAITQFGAIGSGLDRRTSIAAITAMTGMLEGWAKGEKMQFDENYKAWKDASDTIVSNFERQSRYYDDILNDNKMSGEEKKQAIALRAGEFKDAITMETARQGRFDQLDKLWQARAGEMEKLANARKKLEDATVDANASGIDEAVRRWYLGQQDQPTTGLRAGPLTEAANARARTMVEAEAARRGVDPDVIRGEIYDRRTAATSGRRATTAASVAAATSPEIAKRAVQRQQLEQYFVLKNFGNKVDRDLDVLVDLGNQVDRTGVRIFEKFLRQGRLALGDNQVQAFMTQLGQVVPEVARVLNQPRLTGQLTDTARREIAAFMGGDMTAANVRTAVNLLRVDLFNRAYSATEALNSIMPGGANSRPGEQWPMPVALTLDQVNRLRSNLGVRPFNPTEAEAESPAAGGGSTSAPYVAPGPPASIGTYEEWLRSHAR